MDRRFADRQEALLADCQIGPVLFEGMVDRLKEFVQPFAPCLSGTTQMRCAEAYVSGLLSNLEDKNIESIAYFHDQDRHGLQRFVGESAWDHKPMLRLLAEQVGRELGEADGVIVFDPSAFAKKGNASVGVQRQWCGRLSKVENCQVGVFMGYVSRREHTLVDVRLYLPKKWVLSRKRCRKAGVPEEEIRHRTRHALALEMLAEQGPLLPHAWITGDDEMGRSSPFRLDLRALGEQYLLAVPSNTRMRDLESPLPPYGGCGRRPKATWTRVDRWLAELPEQAWTRVEIRAGEKGPVVVEAVKRRIQAKAGKNRVGPEEVLVVIRSRQDDGSWKHDYHFSNASIDTPLSELVRVANAEHRIEECLQRAKSEAGLADYEVRNWLGWYHHQTLSMLATWFLVKEARRGKNTDSRADGATGAYLFGRPVTSRLVWRRHRPHDTYLPTPPTAERVGQVLPLENT
jgi:SRSO17 transposase